MIRISARGTKDAPSENAPLPPLQLASLLAIALIAVFLRCPRILLHGRLFAEEASTYLQYAWDATPFRAAMAPHQGYLSLYPNLVTLAAAYVFPLAWAGLVCAWSALAVQMACAYLLVSCDLLRSFGQRLLALAALLLLQPSSNCFLNTIHSQVYFSVCGGILLVSNTDRFSAFKTTVLTLGGLTGVATSSLFPLFVLRWRRERTPGAALEAAVLGVTAAVQGVAVAYSLHAGARHLTHSYKFMAAALSERLVLEPLAPTSWTRNYYLFLEGHRTVPVLAAASALGLLVIPLVYRLLRPAGKRVEMLALAALWLFTINSLGSMSPGAFLLAPHDADRYFLAPNALLAFALVVYVLRTGWAPSHLPGRLLVATLLLISFARGGMHYWLDWKELHDYPAWQPQITAWQANSRLPLRAAPTSWGLLTRLPRPHPDQPLPFDIFDSSNPKAVAALMH